MSFFSRLFKPSAPVPGTDETSKNVAKERLKLALTYDRGGLAYGTIEHLRDEIIVVIAKHLAISEEDIEINFDSSAEYGKLIASIPLRVGGQRPRAADTVVANVTDHPPVPTAPPADASSAASAPKFPRKRRHR